MAPLVFSVNPGSALSTICVTVSHRRNDEDAFFCSIHMMHKEMYWLKFDSLCSREELGAVNRIPLCSLGCTHRFLFVWSPHYVLVSGCSPEVG